jgi:putative ABC transport system permease protein
MITVTLRDLRWRARRFVIAGMGAATVFALTLVVAGLVSSFKAETGRVLDAIGADAWVVPEGVDGVFTTISVVPQALAAQVAREPGVRRADPIVVLHHTVHVDGIQDVNLIGYADGGLGTPPLHEGRLPDGPGEVVVDTALDVPVGASFPLAGQEVRVVGRTRGLTVNGGQPLVFVPLAQAQRLLVDGAPVASAVVTEGIPQGLPDGYALHDAADTRDDMLRPLAGALASLRLTSVLLWGVAGLVIGSVFYLSALERRRDFAVYKATGWSHRSLAAGLALQSVLLSVAASVVGLVLAALLVPLFPLTFEVPLSSRLLLPVVATGVGLVASLAGLRKAVGVEPALAFGGP